MATTRTSSPYFSPNSARAPDAIASSRLNSRVITGAFCSTMSFAMSSTFSSSAAEIGLGWEMSKRKPVRRDQRTLLRHVIAEHLAQRLVQQMRGRVILPDGAAPRVVDLELERRAELDRALLDPAEMHEQIPGALLRIGDGEAHAVAAHHALIADLAAGFGVERRLIEDDGAGLALGRARRPPCRRATIAATTPARGFGLVAEEFGARRLFADREPHRLGRGLARARPRRARLGALFIHGVGERSDIDADAARPERVLGEIERKAEGVVKRERGDAVEHVALLKVLARLLEDRKAAIERAAEPRLFEFQRLRDQRLGAMQFLIGLAHLAHQCRHQPPHQRILRPEQFRMPHGAAHDAAQHIAAALVRRQHAVGDEERRRAQMVGDDAVRRFLLAIGIDAGQIGDRFDQRGEQIDLVIVVGALQHRGHALDAHAGVDRGPRQIDPPAAAGKLLVLHEDEVPDFDEAVALGLRRARRSAPDVVAVIVEDFRAGAARPGVAHGPEIVGAGDAGDPARRAGRRSSSTA